VGKKSAPTKEIARERLKAVLETDRGHLGGKTLELFKRDIATVMMSYMEIQENRIGVEFLRGNDGQTAMLINVPAVKMRKMPGEIEA
jgi:cell division topological specificity factor